MFTAKLLLLLLLSTTSFRDSADELIAAFGARDPVRMAALWSANVPETDNGRKRLGLLTMVAGNRTAQPAIDDERHLVHFDLYDARGILIEQYTAAFANENGQWRITSFGAAETTLPVPRARELIYRGGELLGAGQLDEALTVFTEAARLGDEANHSSTRAAAQQALGNVYMLRGDVENAARHYEESLAIARAAGQRSGAAHALDRLATLDSRAGNLERAESRLREALQLTRENNDRGFEGWVLNAIGGIHTSRSDYKGAIPLYEEALRIFESLSNTPGVGAVLNNLAAATRALGQYARSIELSTGALEQARTIDDLPSMAEAHSNLGTVQAMQGNLTDAVQSHQEALRIHERLGHEPPLIAALGSVGELHRMLGNAEQARAHFERALGLAEKSGFKAEIARALHNLGQLRRDANDVRGAIALYEKALALDRELGNRSAITRDLHNLGRAQLLAGDRDAARRAFEQSLALAEEVGDPASIAAALTMLGQLAAGTDEAIALSQRALTLATQLGLPEPLWQSHLGLGRALRRAGRLDEARAEVERAVLVVEELRHGVPGEEVAQQRVFETLIEPYHELIALLVEQRLPGLALEYAERAKARALLDVLRNGRPDLAGALTEEERAREAALAAEVAQGNRAYRAALLAGTPAGLPARLRQARLDYDAFLTAMYAAHPQLRRQHGEVGPMQLANLTALLARGEADAFLEFVVAEERTYLFAITPNDLRVHTIDIPRQRLEAEVLRFRELLATHDLGYARAARALYERLLRPVAAQLRGKKIVCIVPDGPLWELPFQALQPKDGEFVLDRHALYSAPSLTVLREMSSRTASPGNRLLALGNPVLPATRAKSVFRDLPLAPLPHTETEIRAIAALYGSRNSRVHLRAEAREEVVKSEAAAFDVLHFATHGVLDEQNALYSRLVFSPPASASEDGLLEAREIMRLDLRAGLAVLSACETARGRVSTGEGVIGMTWALFVAGVPATVVSQWKVDSTSTADLMIDLHRNLRVPGRTKAEALRNAALKTRAKYRHPFYWAPFVVLGSTR